MGALVDGLSPERRNSLTLLEDAKILFRDSGIYLQSSSDGHLNVVADTAIDVAGATNITGATAITGAATITGNATINGDVANKLSSKDGSTYNKITDSDNFPIFQVDSKGNVKTKGTVSKI